MTRGGKRPGAGRKPAPDTKKLHKGFRLRQDVLAYLEQSGNQGETIETAIRNSKAFRDWKRGK